MTPAEAQKYLTRGGAREHSASTAERRVFWLPKIGQWALVVASSSAGYVELTTHADCPCGDA